MPENTWFPSKKWVDPPQMSQKCTLPLERPSMLVPGTPGHRGRIIPPDPYHRLCSLSFFPPPQFNPESRSSSTGIRNGGVRGLGGTVK